MTPLERYLPWRRWAEAGFWIGVTLINAVANTVTVQLDIQRVGLPFRGWEPAIWETSSALLWLALVPGIAWFSRRWPLHWGAFGPQIARHLAASVGVSLLHVLGMVALRHLAYRSMGGHYDFGNWGTSLYYEYLKDVRSYTGMVVLMESYRLLLRRLQGEMHLLDAPEAHAGAAPAGEAPAATEAVNEKPDEIDRPKRFLVRKLNREFLISADDIEWLQAEGNYVNLRVSGHDYLLRSTLAGIAAKLDPARFVRIHRSYIVNLDRLASIEPLDSGDARAHLHSGQVLPCSRSYRAELRERGAMA